MKGGTKEEGANYDYFNVVIIHFYNVSSSTKLAQKLLAHIYSAVFGPSSSLPQNPGHSTASVQKIMN